MRSAVSPDPFELEPSTAFYVPRRATVKALAELQAAIEQDEPLALLRGPSGIGKTLLLRLLRRRVEGRMACVELEARGRSAEELCAAALAGLGREAAPAPIESLARVAAELGRGGVLLLIDAAETLPADALRALHELAAHASSLQIVLAAELGPDEPAWLRSPDPRIALVELVEPMSPRESVEYLLARLERAVAPPEVRKRFTWRHWPRLIRAARGNPARLHHLARRWIEGELPSALPERLEPVVDRPRRSGLWRWLTLGSAALILIGVGVWALLAREAARRDAVPRVAPPIARQVPAPVAPPAVVEPPAPEPPEPAAAADPELPPPAPAVEPLRTEPGIPAAPLPDVDAPPPAPAPTAPAAPARVATPRPERRPPPAIAEAAPLPGAPEPEAPEPPPEPALARVPVFVSAVPAARIEIDGDDVGTTPIAGLPVPVGTRRVVASFPDGRRIERVVDVEGDEVYVLFP